MWYRSVIAGICFMTSYAANADSITLRIMATSDVHGHFTGYNYFTQERESKGLVHTAALIDQQRASADISLLIENGDLIQGSPFTDYMVAAATNETQLPLAELLNRMQYDAVNLGNHEFNYGLEYLSRAYSGVSAPILSANLTATSEFAKQHLNHQPFVVIPRTVSTSVDDTAQAFTVNIGLVGVLPPQIMQWDAHHLRNHVNVESMVAAAQRAVEGARQAGADIVILVAHTGMPKQTSNGQDSEQGVWELAQLDGIDAIVFGHQHEIFPGTDSYDLLAHVNSEKGTIFRIPAVQPGLHGEYLGVIDFVFHYAAAEKRWVVQSKSASVKPVTAERDGELTAQLEPAHRATLAFMQQAIGQTQAPLSQEYARLEPTLAMQFIHDAQLWYIERYAHTNAELAWTNLPRLSAVAPFHAAINASTSADGDFTAIEAGPVTLGDIGDLYRYPNTLDVVVVSGASLKQWLEQSATALKPGNSGDQWGWINTDIPSYQFDTFSGINYRIDPTQPVGKRVQTTPALSETQQYAVVTNNYRANGGGDFAGLNGKQIVYSSPDQIQHILIEYMRWLGEEGYTATLNRNWEIEKQERY
jgi:5''-nucleotidase/2'',3''-cyclic phosphodiesterase and related esterases